MFFDEIKLSKKAWHFKLQMWVFAGFDEPLFMDNFCPYFWLTIFCLIATPFIFTYRGTLKIFACLSRAFNAVADSFEDKVCKPMVEKHLRALKPWDIYNLQKSSNTYIRMGCPTKYWKAYEKLEKWKWLIGSDWENKLNEIIESVKKQIEEKRKLEVEYEQKQEQKNREKYKKKKEKDLERQARRKFYTKVIKYTKWVVIPFVLLVAVAFVCAVAYLIYLGLRLLYSWVFSNPKACLAAVGIFAGIILSVLFVWALCILCKKLFGCFTFFVPKNKIKLGKAKKFKTEPSFISRLIDAVISTFQIFIDYVKVFKQNNCPAIKWKEDE